MEFEFDGSEGKISVRLWEHPGARRVVVIAHGYGEHIERYDHVARALRARGAAVYGPDHLGHGRSAGERVLITDLEHVVDDVVQVLLQLPGEAECKLQARVVWSQPAGPGVDEPGMGLEFLDADDQTRQRLGRIVAQLSKDLAVAPG